jgi:hypothetical protein
MGPNIRQALVKHVLAQASLTGACSLSPHLSAKIRMPWQGCHNMTAAGGSHFQDQSFHWHLSGLHFGDYTCVVGQRPDAATGLRR